MRYLFFAGLSILLLASCQNRNQRFNMDVAVDVVIETMKPGSISEMVTVTGDLQPEKAVVLKNEMTGEYRLLINPATRAFFKMGDRVKAGTVIVELEDRAYRNTANLEGEKLNLDISEQEYQKQLALYEKGGVTMRELVNAERTMVTARKTYENAQINLAKMTIKAPFDGVITSLPYHSQNVRLEQGQDIVGLMNFDRMVLDVTLPLTAFGKVKPQQKVFITNYASSEDTVPGVVTQLSPALDVDTRSFKGRLAVENRINVLRPGMFVNAAITIQQKEAVFTVPADVVLTQMGGKYVFVVEGETARKRIVQTGLEGKERVEIASGLKADDQVVVKGFETLRDGSKIKITDKR